MVTLLGKRVGFKLMEAKLNCEWAKKGAIKDFDVSREYYQVLFSSNEDYNHAIFDGSWMVVDHYILVQRWRSFFLANTNVARKLAMWIRVPVLPTELFSNEFLTRLGSTLGVMLKVDKVMTVQTRGCFVRICVEIGLDEPLQAKVIARGYLLHLQYGGLHSICYGHKDSSCLERKIAENPDTSEEKKNW